ncbi:MAG: ArsR family transcriptional regulator [Proteobacteria bacterium]|nr:ArsR family transcriptional regulator [Pseudomonadota bacterium]
MATKKVKSDRCVTMLKALADEHRWDIVRTLLAESLSVSELGARLGMAQPNVSKHLGTLRAAGIVVTERVGKEVHGSIAPAFRAELSKNANRLDLGCCSFDFNSPRK